jgi:hypothetical protein
VERLPPSLEQKRRDLASALGRPVVVRGIRTPDPHLRGRLRVQPRRVLIEYQVAQQGYFWHIPIIEELLDRAAGGETALDLRLAHDSPAEAAGREPDSPPPER